jgi:predicted TIM-barrel fold metal-dependent hydrolase
MTVSRWRRRAILAAVPGIAAGVIASRPATAQQVPHSSGTEKPKTKAPPNATDCHHHIYDSRYPADPRATLRPADATVADYRKLQERLGIKRHVIIQPSTYGTDNRDVVESIAAFGPEARGIAVLDDSVSDAELKRLNDQGIRGLRFNLTLPGGPPASAMEPLARRINDLGWHAQINCTAAQVMELESMLRGLPTQLVFDHLGHLPEPEGARHPAFRVITDLMTKRRAWVKLSGAYIDSKVGPPTYADSTEVAQAYVREAPERLVWGSDWPHPTEHHTKPDDAVLFDLLAIWAPDEAVRTRILVQNPEELYGFPKSA